jgi:MYXO-CTERM domain-containing protein
VDTRGLWAMRRPRRPSACSPDRDGERWPRVSVIGLWALLLLVSLFKATGPGLCSAPGRGPSSDAWSRAPPA